MVRYKRGVMLYRRFGRTELQIPLLSCGAMRFQHSWKAADAVSAESQHNLEACVLRALAEAHQLLVGEPVKRLMQE